MTRESFTTPEVAEAVTAALVVLARHNIPTDVQELLVGGNPAKGIAPGALRAAIAALPPSNMIGEALYEDGTISMSGSMVIIDFDDRKHAEAMLNALMDAHATLSKLREEFHGQG